MNRSEQKTIGSSDVSAVLGLNPHCTPYQVWARLVGIETPQNLDGNRFVYWGNKLEPVIGAEMESHLCQALIKNDRSWQDEEHLFLSATPDYVNSPRTLLAECKNTSGYKAHEWEDGGCPDHAHAQLMHQMRVTKIHHGFVGGLIGGNQFEIREFEFDAELSAAITDQLVSFWDYVEKVTPPPLLAEDHEAIKARYKIDNGETIELEEGNESLVREIIDAKKAIKEFEARKNKAEAEIKSMMQESATAKCGAYTISWKGYEQRRVDSEKLKEKHKSVYTECCKTIKSRRFLIK